MFAESGHARHAPLIALYRETGLFAWSAGLRQLGASSSARVVFIIDRCIRRPGHDLQQLAAAAVRAQSADALTEVLARAHRRYGRDPVHMGELAEPAPLAADAGWDAYSALAELMAAELGPRVLDYARAQLRRRGLQVGDDALHDLAALFTNMHLRSALSAFDPVQGEGREAAWLGTVFYRYALRQVLAMRQTVALADWLEQEDLPAPESDPLAVLEQRAQEQVLALLPQQLGLLPQLERQALSLYFGFACREHTVAEVAEALGTNPYFARTALVSGLGALAAASGTSGVLTEDELALARAVFLERRCVEQLARAQGRSSAEVRRAVSAVTRKLQSTLRRRTRLPRSDSPLRSAPTTMARLPGDHSKMFSAFVTQDRSAFTADTPTWPTSVPEPRTRPEATPRRDPVPARTEGPDAARNGRPDLLPGDEAWLRELDEAAARTLANVAPWLDAVRERAAEAGVALDEEPGLADDEAWLHALSDGAAATTAALEEMLPRSARRAEVVRLVIEGLTVGGEPEAHFEAGDWHSESVPLHALLSHRLGFAGGLSAAVADLAASSGMQVLAERSSSLLPGFIGEPEAAASHGRLVLRWVNPLKAVRGG